MNLFQLTRKHVKSAANMLARAFYNDPLHVAYFPDISIRKERLHFLFEHNIRYCIRHGEAFATSPNLEGIALWELADPQEETQQKSFLNYGWNLLFQLALRVGKEALVRIFSYDYVYKTHFTLVPSRHWYFFNIGVDPNLQGKGYASSLINPMLVRIDRENLSCYLDCNDEKNVAIYQHYGFKVLKKYQIPEINITNWSMLREAK